MPGLCSFNHPSKSMCWFISFCTNEMDSTPPATYTSPSPAITRCAASAMACNPDEQKRLTVMPGTLTGRPARSAICRAMFMPVAPSGFAQPMITSSTRAGSMPARATAACVAWPPSVAPWVMLNAPRQDFARPVRAVDTITASVMLVSTSNTNSVGSTALIHLSRRSAQQVRRSDPRYTRRRHLLPRTRKRPVEIDGATGIVDNDRFEARAARIERGPRDAIIRRQPAAIDPLRADIAEIPREACRRLAIGFHEGRITIDIHVMTLANHQPRVRHVQIAMQRRAVRVLHAMRRPQDLLTVPHRGHVKRRAPRMMFAE